MKWVYFLFGVTLVAGVYYWNSHGDNGRQRTQINDAAMMASVDPGPTSTDPAPLASTSNALVPADAAQQRASMQLPIPKTDSISAPPPAAIWLWQSPHASAATTLDGIPAYSLQVDPAALKQFQVGQTVVLPVDESGSELEAELTSTYNDDHGVKIWHGALTDAPPGSGLVIAQGAAETHLIITSPSGTYSAVINNATGAATFIDEGEIFAGQASFDDAIPVAPLADAAPPPLD